MIISTTVNNAISQNVQGKFVTLDCSLDEEFIWRQTATDLLLNYFKDEKKNKLILNYRDKI